MTGRTRREMWQTTKEGIQFKSKEVLLSIFLVKTVIIWIVSECFTLSAFHFHEWLLTCVFIPRDVLQYYSKNHVMRFSGLINGCYLQFWECPMYLLLGKKVTQSLKVLPIESELLKWILDTIVLISIIFIVMVKSERAWSPDTSGLTRWLCLYLSICK